MYLMNAEYRLPKVLATRMKEKNISFKRLSQLSDVNIKTLYHWANGQRPRDPIAIYRVAMALELPMENLIFGNTCKTQRQADIGSYELILYKISSEGVRQLIAGHKE